MFIIPDKAARFDLLQLTWLGWLNLILSLTVGFLPSLFKNLTHQPPVEPTGRGIWVFFGGMLGLGCFFGVKSALQLLGFSIVRPPIAPAILGALPKAAQLQRAVPLFVVLNILCWLLLAFGRMDRTIWGSVSFCLALALGELLWIVMPVFVFRLATATKLSVTESIFYTLWCTMPVLGLWAIWAINARFTQALASHKDESASGNLVNA